MKTMAIFNNKGGVGKTTLTYHTASALAELGYRTLLVDLDPQSNLTLFGLDVDALYQVWLAEDPFIEDFDRAGEQLVSKISRDFLPSHVLFISCSNQRRTERQS